MWPEAELGRIFRDWGEERAWRRLASKIVEVRRVQAPGFQARCDGRLLMTPVFSQVCCGEGLPCHQACQQGYRGGCASSPITRLGNKSVRLSIASSSGLPARCYFNLYPNT